METWCHMATRFRAIESVILFIRSSNLPITLTTLNSLSKHCPQALQHQLATACGMPRGAPVVYTRASVYDVIKHYDVKEDIGYGGYAVVKKGIDKRTGETVAIKIVDKAKYDPGDDRLQHEIEVLMKINHPRCISLYDVFIAHQKVFIVTEYVTGGEVLERLQKHGPYSERAASKIIQHVMEGVAYLHENGVVHRDLKLENLLLVDKRLDSNAKIADFGLSKHFGMDESVLATMCGSPEYVAPEVLGVEETSENYSSAIDMWSLGVVLFAMMCCYTPFYDDNQSKMYRNILTGKWNREDANWLRLSSPLKDLISKLLLVNPAARLNAKEGLKHPWVNGSSFPPTQNPGESSPQMRNRAQRPQISDLDSISIVSELFLYCFDSWSGYEKGPVHPYADIVHQQREEEDEVLDEYIDAEEGPVEGDECTEPIQMSAQHQANENSAVIRQDLPLPQRIRQPNRGASTTW